MVPDTPAARATERAVNTLLAAGMVLRYRSAHGNSYYLGWPGRKGTLRVSDHSISKSWDQAAIAKCTFSDEWVIKMSDADFRLKLAQALGNYLLKSALGPASDNPYGQNWLPESGSGSKPIDKEPDR